MSIFQEQKRQACQDFRYCSGRGPYLLRDPYLRETSSHLAETEGRGADVADSFLSRCWCTEEKFWGMCMFGHVLCNNTFFKLKKHCFWNTRLDLRNYSNISEKLRYIFVGIFCIKMCTWVYWVCWVNF